MPTGTRKVPEDPVLAEILGEIRAQLRELFHTRANDQQRDAAMASTLAKLEMVPKKLDDISDRLSILEGEKLRREGANGLIVAIVKSPLVGWLVGGITAAIIWFKGNG